MKKIYIILTLLIIGGSLYSENQVYAELITERGVTDDGTIVNPGDSTSSDTAGAGSKSTTVYVTEKVPGATCTCAVDNRDANDIRAGVTLESQCGDITTRKYKCTIEPGFGSFQKSIQGITGWFTQIALILSVLVVVLLGIAWAIWGSSEEKVKFLKGWTINILIGIVTLFFFQYILVMLAPWVFK